MTPAIRMIQPTFSNDTHRRTRTRMLATVHSKQCRLLHQIFTQVTYSNLTHLRVCELQKFKSLYNITLLLAEPDVQDLVILRDIY